MRCLPTRVGRHSSRRAPPLTAGSAAFCKVICAALADSSLGTARPLPMPHVATVTNEWRRPVGVMQCAAGGRAVYCTLEKIRQGSTKRLGRTVLCCAALRCAVVCRAVRRGAERCGAVQSRAVVCRREIGGEMAHIPFLDATLHTRRRARWRAAYSTSVT